MTAKNQYVTIYSSMESDRQLIEQLNEYFKKDAFVKLAGIEILSADDKSTAVGFNVRPIHLNANGVVQGGAIYTLADFAFAVHANRLHGDTVTQNGEIHYLAPGDSDYITATAIEIASRGHTCVHRVTVNNNEGGVIAVATISGFIKNPIGGHK